MIKGVLYILVGLILCTGGAAWAQSDAGFAAWVTNFRADARAAGIRADVINEALADVKFIPRIIELDQKQPEKTKTFAEYKKGVLNLKRIADGRRLYREHYKLLKEIEGEYGVPASVIVALWGIETSYGRMTGGYEIIDSLATLAYEGRRGPYFKGELIAALRILQQEHITRDQLKGSWAGAMGQNQFMPSSYLRLAMDHNNDGHRDIWGTIPDVFASSANFLNQAGWVEGEGWGRAVKLSPDFDLDQIGLGIKRSVSEWVAHGVKTSGGQPLPASNQLGSIVRPGDGPDAYLVYQNYWAIMAWNKSTYFATSVGLLSDMIASGR